MSAQQRAKRDGAAQPDNRLSFMDQAFFSTTVAHGRGAIIQCLWIYDHAVDLDGLQRFNDNLAHGLLGRRIERSPLPFARYRWVSSPTPPDIDVAATARPPAELSDWADERAQLLVDPEQGPNWHIGVLPFTDGSTAVSLVSSHCVVDGLGVGVAVAEAISGIRRDLGYPPPRSRTRLRAVAEDGCQTVRGLPDVGRAIVAAVKDLRRRKDASDTSGGSQPVAVAAGSGDERVIVPTVMVHVDEDDWDTRAKALGGMSHHLVAGFAAKFGGRMGRRRSRDGAVTVQLPISERTETDTRANALSFVSITVDPAQVTTSLHQIRIASRQAFTTMREKPDDTAQINAQTAAVPFVPRRLLARIADAAYAYDDLPVGCSNAGDIGAALGRPDGTAAAFGSVRGGEQRVTRGHLERTRGQLVLWVVRFGGKICITAAGYQPGAVTTKAELRGLAAQTLADFDLTGVVT